MGQITVEKNVKGINGLCVITPTVHGDSRGNFLETYSQRDMKEAGFDITFVQDNHKQFLIPRGFAHGFLVLSDRAEFCNKCDDFYHPNDEGGMAWNDPEIGIVWPRVKGEYKGTAKADGYTIDGKPLDISAKDQGWNGLRETFRF